jgi:hypothetical protein
MIPANVPFPVRLRVPRESVSRTFALLDLAWRESPPCDERLLNIITTRLDWQGTGSLGESRIRTINRITFDSLAHACPHPYYHTSLSCYYFTRTSRSLPATWTLSNILLQVRPGLS